MEISSESPSFLNKFCFIAYGIPLLRLYEYFFMIFQVTKHILIDLR